MFGQDERAYATAHGLHYHLRRHGAPDVLTLAGTGCHCQRTVFSHICFTPHRSCCSHISHTNVLHRSALNASAVRRVIRRSPPVLFEGVVRTVQASSNAAPALPGFCDGGVPQHRCCQHMLSPSVLDRLTTGHQPFLLSVSALQISD